MILSHAYKFIFVKTEKTSGTSLEIALSKFCGLQDIITPISSKDENKRKSFNFQTAQNYSYSLAELGLKGVAKPFHKKKVQKFYNHIPASIIKQRIPQSIWENYYKFTIARNPIDRVLSLYFWTMKSDQPAIDFPTFLRRYGYRIYSNWELISEGNQFLLDDFILYEDPATDMQRIGEKIGLPENLYNIYSSITTKSGLRSKDQSKTYCGPEESNFISYLCKPEMACFGYFEKT